MPLKEKQIIHIVFPDKLHIQFDNYDHRSPLVDKLNELLAGQILMKEQLKRIIDLLIEGNGASNDRIGKKLDAMIQDVKSTI